MIDIVFENNDILVVDKPAGLLVHPVNPEQKDTLVDKLVSRYPEIKKVGDDPQRPGIVHRLDKDTSGLMVIAKNEATFNYLKKQFQDRKVIKKYLALVHGQVKDEKGTITKAINFSKKDYRKRSALLDDKAKPAWTEYNVLKRFADYTLLEVQIKTGRTHQIRVHLSSIGHPVAGDKQYKFKRQPQIPGLKRQFLHAFYLKFKLADGKLKAFRSDLPKELWTKLTYLTKNN